MVVSQHGFARVRRRRTHPVPRVRRRVRGTGARVSVCRELPSLSPRRATLGLRPAAVHVVESRCRFEGGRMNWKTVVELSLFGLLIGIGTVFVIPSTVEPLLWIVVFVASAYVIARRCPWHEFVHGLLVGIANSVWVTASHVVFFHRYLANHPQEAAMMSSMPAPDSPRLMMAMVGPLIGIVSGALIGLLALLARKLLGSRPATV